MARWEKEPLLDQRLHQDAAADSRPGYGGHGFTIDRVGVEMFHHDQDAIVSHMVGRPAMPSRTNADLFADRLRVQKSRLNIGNIFWFDDQQWFLGQWPLIKQAGF